MIANNVSISGNPQFVNQSQNSVSFKNMQNQQNIYSTQQSSQPYVGHQGQMAGLAYQTHQDNSHLLRDSLESSSKQHSINQGLSGAMHSSYHHQPTAPINMSAPNTVTHQSGKFQSGQNWHQKTMKPFNQQPTNSKMIAKQYVVGQPMKKYGSKGIQRGESNPNQTTKSTSNTAMGVVQALEAYQ